MKDQTGRTVLINKLPQRMVSLVPSQTELLYDLGLDERIVGQTLFCIHPAEAHKTKPRVGGTKKLNMQKIHELKPDLIIANKEENEQEQVETLMQEFPVWISDIKNLNDALQMIKCVGELTGKTNEANLIVSEIESGFAKLSNKKTNKKALYLIWRKPYMAAGNDTFIGDMLKRCGWINATQGNRYPELSEDNIAQLQPDIILLSSEPYPFKEKHIDELKTICPNANIFLADGELFSWYGSRLRKSVEYFKELSF